MKLDKSTKNQLIELYKTKKIGLEGNILKLIEPDGDEEFTSYIKESIDRDKDSRRKRLDITKQVQSQNADLTKWKNENERVNKELTSALEEAEESNKSMLVHPPLFKILIRATKSLAKRALVVPSGLVAVPATVKSLDSDIVLPFGVAC